MSLRRKAVLGIAIAFAVVMSGLLLFDRLLIVDQFDEVERREVVRDAQRARNAIDVESRSLDILLLDWAFWDDTYEFMETRSPEYVESNLVEDITTSLSLDVFMFLEPDGTAVYSRTQWPSGEEAPIPGLTQGAEILQSLLAYAMEDGERQGIISLPVEYGMLIAARPILRSDGGGKPRGMILMGRWLDDEFSDALAESLQTPLRFEHLDDEPDVAAAALEAEGRSIAIVENGELNGQAVLLDVDGEPALLLETNQRRDISTLQDRTYLLTAIAVGTTTLVLSGLMFLGVYFILLRGLLRLRDEMDAVDSRGGRVTEDGSDEVAQVARSINEMLERLSLSSREQQRLAILASEQEEVARTALLEMSEGFLSFGENGRCILCNPAAGRLLGIDPQDAPGRYIADLLPPAARTTSDSGALQIIEVGRRSIAVSRTEGRERSGRRSVVVLRDVSDVLDIERLRRDIVTTVSHELRTPLTAIRATVDLFQGGDGGALTEVQQRMIGLLSRNTDRLLHIVNDLLALSSLEGRSVTLQRDDVDIALLAARVAEDLGPAAAAADVTITLSGAMSAIVWGDDSRLRQVLENLVQNAIEFSPDGGAVTVVVLQGHQEVTVQIRDAGIGIPPEEHERVFEKFYRTAAGQRMTGSGLGLTIVRLVVELHGGRIWIESTEGRGTTVSFTVPMPPGMEAR